MANKKDIPAVEEITTTEQVTIDKTKLEAILAGYEEMKGQIAKLSEQTVAITNKADNKQRKEEQRLLEIVKKANEEAEELVEYHVDMGALRSNKNLEVSINGVQTIIPKGQTVMLKKSVVEVIENSKKQMEIALGLQEKRNEEAQKAENEGGIKE